MASKTIESSSNGIGIGTVLFLVFLVLKLTHTIAWSWWWWVTAPLWIPAGFVIVILSFVLLIIAIAALAS